MGIDVGCQSKAIILVYPDIPAESAITKAFKWYGGEYVILHDVKELKSTVIEMNPDVVILRADFPGYDLYSLIQELFTWNIASDLPILVVFENNNGDDSTSYLQMKGVLNAWVREPFHPKEVKILVCRLIRARCEGREMIKQAQEELMNNNNSIDVYYRLSNGYEKLNCYQKAINILLKALLIEPENAQTHFHICLAYYRDLDYINAVQHWRLAKQYGNEQIREEADKLRRSGYTWHRLLENEP